MIVMLHMISIVILVVYIQGRIRICIIVVIGLMYKFKFFYTNYIFFMATCLYIYIEYIYKKVHCLLAGLFCTKYSYICFK